MYKVGDKITVRWPEEPPVGSTVHGALTMFGYQRTEEGWVNLYKPHRSPISWKLLLRDEENVEITSIPYTVGTAFSGTERLRRLPVGTVVTVLGGVVPYTKIARCLWIRNDSGHISEKQDQDLTDVVFQIQYVPKEQ